MAVSIEGCNFVVQEDEAESPWKGMVVMPPREDVLVTQSENPEQALLDILALAQYVLILNDGSAGLLSPRDLVTACETLQQTSNEAETFLAQQEEPCDRVTSMRGIMEKMLPRTTRPWYVFHQRDTSGLLSYVVTTQRVPRHVSDSR